jgi:hypothetical protein
VWWNTHHPYRAGEALAAATLLATLLYQQTHSSFDLAQAQQFLVWANTHGYSPADQLYARSDQVATPEDYIEAPLIYAQELLCKAGDDGDGCQRADELTDTSLRRFGSTLDFAPQYDAIYLQWMLALYASDHDTRLYQLAAANAATAAQHARDSQGLFLLSWAGQPLAALQGAPGMLRTQAATTSLFAWLAVYPPPV